MVSFILPGNSATGGFNVANSLRFDDGSSDHLTRSLGASETSTQKGTFSFWVKRGQLTTAQIIYTNEVANDNNRGFIQFEDDDTFRIKDTVSGSNTTFYATTQLFRDTSAWYHMVVALDSTASAGERITIFKNGTRIPDSQFGTSTEPSENANFNILTGGQTNKNHIGKIHGGSTHFDGYLAEFVYCDGQVLDADSFGEFDEDSGIWKPIDVSGLTFGNNGFYLDFEDSSALGNDKAGSNNFTVNNLTAIDQATDTPTNNAVTFMSNNPSAANFTLSEGNLKVNKSGSGQFGLYGSSIMLTEGKWYWEVKFTADAGSDRTRAGVAAYESVTGTSTIQGSYSGFEFTCNTSGRFSITENGSTTEIDGFNSYSTGDIIRFALDMDNTKLYVGRNGDWFNYSSSATGGDPTSGSGYVTNSAIALAAPVTIYAGHSVGVSGSSELEYNFGATNTFSVSSGNSDGNGYGNFEYAVPSGYYALNTKNLAEYG